MASVFGNWNWRRAVAESELPSTTKLVLFTLSIHVPETGAGAFPAIATLVRETSLTRKTVQSHLVKARDLGWISVEERFARTGRQTSNFYRLSVPAGVGEGVGDTPSEGVGGTQGEGVASSPPVSLKGPRRNGAKKGSSQGELLPVSGAGSTKAKREDFEALWKLAPGRGSKKKSWDRYREAVPKKVDAETIHLARAAVVVMVSESRFVKYLETWIRDEGWADVEVLDVIREPEPGSDEWLAAEGARILDA